MTITKKSTKIDFASGPVWKCIIAQAIPLTIAQLVQLLYNVVDRIYLGHMGDVPQEDLLIIRNIFNKGCTFWHDATNMYNYNLTNSIV